MALGYCMECNELRTIRPGAQQWGTRQCDWFPTTHWISVHKICGSVVRFDDYAICLKCGPVTVDHVEEIRCPGEKKAIK